MLRAPLQRAYLRLGARYPRIALAAVFQLSYLVVLGGVLLLDVYVELSTPAFWRILAVCEAATALEIAAALWVCFRLVRPADAWLNGDRTPQTAAAAWRALAGLPLDLIRYLRGLPVVLNIVPISVYVALEVGGRFLPVLLRHGGHANKFVGDGLLGVFGAPDRLPDHADRGVAAALEITEVIRRTYGGALRAGIGVNSGAVLAGTIGGRGRGEVTVIGDTVNTAARVEQATRETGDDVLVTDATCRLLTRDHGGFAERHGVALRGKAERVRLHAPLAAAAGADGGPAPAAVRAARRQ